MVTNSSLARRIVAQELLLQRLLADTALVGGIYVMGYEECLVLTNDLWKQQAGGGAAALLPPCHCDAPWRGARYRR